MNSEYTDLKILSFYGWWEMSTCLFAFAALLAIWWHVGKKKNDFGQVWLALSILCWSFSGLGEIIFANRSLSLINENNADPDVYQYYIEGFRSIFSLLNSLLILLALPYFKYIPKTLLPIIKSKFWIWIIGLPFVFSLLPTISLIIRKSPSTIISELDVYYGILTLIFLGMVLWESFSKRRLKVLAYLSMICIMITFASQLFKLGNLYVNTMLSSAIFKTSLIMIFFALALSWIKDLTETLNMSVNDLSLDFNVQNQKDNLHKVSISGINNLNNSLVKLTRGQYNLLKTFASKKVNREDDGWLNIKPKSEKRTNKSYDINDHNEIKRLVQGLLDEIYGKGLWSKSQHEDPFKNTLLENSEIEERKIRLKVPAANIKL